MDRNRKNKADKQRAEWRFTRFGSVFLSYDFYLGIPLGAIAALSSIFSSEVRNALPGLLIGVAGVGAAVATLILTSLAVHLGSISPVYRRYLSKTEDGVAGTIRPFRLIATVAASTTAWSLIAAGLIPLTKPNGWASFAITAPAFGLLLWAVFGCIQAIGQITYHWENRARAEQLEERRQAALKRLA